VRLFAAATLAQIDPNLHALGGVWNLWTTIAERTLASGEYDPEAEIRAHRELSGASVKNSYLVLRNRYALTLLGSRAGQLPKKLERTLVSWIWRDERGIGYLDAPLSRVPPRMQTGFLDRWFTSLEIVSRFPSWGGFAVDAMDWLWSQQDERGLWDFGPVSVPLSESRRRKENRRHDWSMRILALLAAH
jgi:hypothetical protein